ncbi:MAG: alanine racemase [Clostridia bacterium]|nr:alanine racemase [Clostridia bacterium]
MSKQITAEISIKNLLYNVKQVKKLIGKSKFCAVIKADAYGHGLTEFANALYPNVDAYAVSLESECVKLRQAGIDKEIILLTPVFTDNVERLILNKITLSVSTEEELKLIYRYAKKLGRVVKIHFALNTGMNRLGFSSESEVLNAVNYVKKHKNNLFLTGAFSHLGNAKNVKYANCQRKQFELLVRLIKEYNVNATLHLASSGGVLLGEKFLYDMVRVGIMLYGYTPYKTKKITLKKTATILAPILLSRDNVFNKRVMYGDKKCKTNSISVARIGYADGIRREKTYGVIGNACMDVSAVKKVNGNNFIISDLSLLSKKYHTITYETLVSVLKRAERIYK